MASEGIFRFVSFRPASTKRSDQSSGPRLELYSNNDESVLRDAVLKGIATGLSVAELAKLGQDFKASDEYINRLGELENGAALLGWFEEHKGDRISVACLPNIERHRELVRRLADSLLAVTLSPGETSNFSLQSNMLGLKLLRWSEAKRSTLRSMDEDSHLGSWIARQVLRIPKALMHPAMDHKVPSRSKLAQNALQPQRLPSAEALQHAHSVSARDEGTAGGGQPVLSLGGFLVDVSLFRDATQTAGEAFFSMLARCQRNVGVGDLLIIKQRLKAYELADFAHIENILDGESRSRDHRRLRRTEDTFISEREKETTTERDLQSADRGELQREIEETIQTQTSLQGNLQLSGSYGPTVSFTSNVGASLSVSTDEASRKAVSFSREVTERAAERIRERVLEQQTTTIIEETEETNHHGIVNAPAGRGHIRGIYRWLNKVSEAEVQIYGQRMMFEFILPEPAAFFLYALIDNPPENGLVLKRPDPPMYTPPRETKPRPLQPADLDSKTYQAYVSQYQVAGVKPVPALNQWVAYSYAVDAADQSTLIIAGHAKNLTIPEGYVAEEAVVQLDISTKKEESYSARVRVAGVSYIQDSNGDVKTLVLPEGVSGEIPISVLLDDVYNWSLGVQVKCLRTDETLAEWQHSTYDAIIEAYQRQLQAHEDRLRAEQIQQGIPVLGRNPLENRRIERQELKKLAIQFLTGGSILGNDFFVLDSPIVDVAAACEQGKHIQFIENAFEWRNMQYVFYPYFWGRYARWTTAIHFTDPDPEFAEFLTAGAARVQVPVRPGYEKAVAYYCQHPGAPYGGEDPPLIDDDLYLPIAEEISEGLGRYDGGIRYPADSEPWEVRVPTQLVVLQDLREVPGITDVLTGKDISLEPLS